MIGVLLLVLAATGAVIVRGVLAPGTAGTPASAPLPLPPAVGSCVDLDAGVEVVSCDAPHTAEVIMSWPAGRAPGSAVHAEQQPRMTFSVSKQLPYAESDQVCQQWADSYTGWSDYLAEHADDLWIPPRPMVVGRLVDAPADQGLPDKHWTACVAETGQHLFSGSVAESALYLGGHRPDAVSVCLTSTTLRVEFSSCSVAHTTELIGTIALTNEMMFRRTVLIDRTAEEVQQRCVDLARTVTGADDPTYGGQLDIVTESVWQQRESPVTIAAPGWFIPDCLLRVAGTQSLSGSVIGLGDGPLPLS